MQYRERLKQINLKPLGGEKLTQTTSPPNKTTWHPSIERNWLCEVSTTAGRVPEKKHEGNLKQVQKYPKHTDQPSSLCLTF